MIRLPWHISIRGAQRLEAASAAADHMWGMWQRQQGEDGLASGLQICLSATLRANWEQAEVRQAAPASPALVLSQAGAGSSKPGLPRDEVQVEEGSTCLIKAVRGSGIRCTGSSASV